MTEHDQTVCLRCGKPVGDRRFCEPCYSQLSSFTESVRHVRGDISDVIHSAAPAGREVRHGQRLAAGGGDSHDPPPAQDAILELCGGALEPGKLSSGAYARPDATSRRPREVARFDAVLTPDEVDPELEACRRADAAGDPQGATNLGVLLEERGDLEGALAAYRRADRRGDVNGSFNLGCLLSEMGDPAGAQDALQRADERGDAAAASNLGVLLERQGNLDGALAAYRRGDGRGGAVAAFNLGLLLAGRGDHAGARAAYRRAAERDDPEVRRRAAQAEAELPPAHARPVPSVEIQSLAREGEGADASAPIPEPEAGADQSAADVPEAVTAGDEVRHQRGVHGSSRRRWIIALYILALTAIVVSRGRRRSP